MGKSRKLRKRSQHGMIAQPPTMACAADVNVTSEKLEEIADRVRESATFISIQYGTRARKLADEMLKLFSDTSRISPQEALTAEMRVSRLFTQAIIDLRFGNLMDEKDIRGARINVEAAFHEVIARQ